MNALSIRQPWAHYILHYGKDVENRTWKSPVRGRVLIHAGKAWDVAPEDGIVYGKVTAPDLPAYEFVRGSIIGAVTIIEMWYDHPSEWSVRGQYQFVLTDPVAFATPIPYPGKPGFFDVPESVVIAIPEIAR